MSFTNDTLFFFEDFTLTWKILMDKRFLQVTVQRGESHAAPGAIDGLLFGAFGIFAHKVAEL